MTKVKKNYSASFKAQVALSLIREDETISELSSRYGVNPSVMRRWKKQALDNMEGIFLDKIKKTEQNHEEEIEKLHTKIGKLTVEKDFLADASRRLGLFGGKK